MPVRLRAMILSAVLVLSLAPVRAAGPSFPVETLWVAESLGGTAFASVSRPTLRIGRDGRAGGSAGCNRYMGKVEIAGPALTVGPLAMTRMACFGAGGDNERRFAQAMSRASRWSLVRRQLVIETPDGPLVFRRR